MNWSKAVASLVLGSFVMACAAAPIGAITDDVKAENNADKSKNTADDKKADQKTEKTSTAKMTLSTVSPATVVVGSSRGGLTVTLAGTGFASGMKLAIGETRVATTVASETSLTAIIPAAELDAVATLSLALIASDDTRSNAITLTVSDKGAELLTGLNPISTDVRLSNSESMNLTVQGSGFVSGDVVVFNGVEVPTTLVSATSLKGTIASSLLRNAGQVNVAVKQGGKLSAPLVFTINDGFGGRASCGGGSTCAELGLSRNECALVGFDLVECRSDGCVYVGCN
jgi:hypothetical protein